MNEPKPQAREDAQPVAWRYRFVTSTDGRDWSDWFVVDDRASIPSRDHQTIQPLYDRPAPNAQPVEVTIFCPKCKLPHVDEGEWATTRHHKTHQCQGCGHEWRPFPFATVGVTHPAPDALRAREALSALVIADDHRPRGPGTPSDWIRNSYAPAIALARQTLAALQAEQGAK